MVNSNDSAPTTSTESDYQHLAERSGSLKSETALMNVARAGENHEQQQQQQHDVLLEKNSCDNDQEENGISSDEIIRRDAANDRVACAVHLALTFFAVLVVAAIVLCAVVVAKFGLIAFGLLGLLALLFVSLVAFVNKVLREDDKLKPVRRQLERWQALAKAVVLQEVRNFQLDWHEHLLLTDGKTEYEGDAAEDTTVHNNQQKECDFHTNLHQKTSNKRGKSIVFRLIVKPYLNIKIKRRTNKAR